MTTPSTGGWPTAEQPAAAPVAPDANAWPTGIHLAPDVIPAPAVDVSSTPPTYPQQPAQHPPADPAGTALPTQAWPTQPSDITASMSRVPTPYELIQKLKQIAPEFSVAATEKGRLQQLPPRKKMADLIRAQPGAQDELIKDRFLCRGGAMMIAAQSGKGKSSLVRQIAICFAAGLPIFGMTPARPLRQLIVQAENDEGDEAAFRDGISICPYAAPGGADEAAPAPIDPATLATALAQITIAKCDDKTGAGFLETLEALIAADGPFDLVWIDPFLAYLGGDCNDQKTVSLFLRNGLQPLMRRNDIGIGLVHHTPKPIRQVAKGAPIVDIGAYLGAGSAELTNWPRAVLTLENTNHRGVFRLRAPKRGMRLGWRDQETGDRTDSRHLAHATDGSIYWREPSPEELAAAIEPESTTAGLRRSKAGAQEVVDILAAAGGEMTYSDLREHIQVATGCGKTSAAEAIQKAVASGQARSRGTCPAFYHATRKAQPSQYSPLTTQPQEDTNDNTIPF